MHNAPQLIRRTARVVQHHENHTGAEMLALTHESRLGQYEIVEALGVRGMLVIFVSYRPRL